jgi:hypothetical protein
MKIWIQYFGFAVLLLLLGAVINNTLNFSAAVKWILFLIILIISILFANMYSKSKDDFPQDGMGGRGGGGNATGKNSKVIGGKGGKGGSPDSGRGGDGGGGDATGEGSLVIGGDGGDAGRSDGRGGKGGESPLKKLPPEVLKSFGLTGNEGYGQGGSGTNTPEYDRRLRVLNVLSSEFVSNYPDVQMTPMPGILMPPIQWVNNRLIQNGENFSVEIIDIRQEFIFHSLK